MFLVAEHPWLVLFGVMENGVMPKFLMVLMASASLTASAVAGSDTYRLDQADFASSTDWFLIDNFPTQKKADPKDSLIFRRFYFVYVDGKLREGTFANTISFVCSKKHLDHLLIHVPDSADIKTIRPRKQWLSKTELRVLTDDAGVKFDAEYIDGDFFVDFSDDGAIDNLLRALKSRSMTIEFGPGNERISLYTGDTSPDGKADIKAALKEIMPMYAKSIRGKSRIVGMSEMFKMCDMYRNGRTARMVP
jgi:hypothetical protein